MGLFKKSKPSTSSAQAERVRPPVSFADGDLERCDAALARFEGSYGRGQDAPVRAALLGIAQAGGYGGLEWQMNEMYEGRDVGDKPWRWLALMAEVASNSGDAVLTARIAFFFMIFSQEIGPNLQLADLLDIGLEKQQPPASYASVLAYAITTLGSVDPDTTILQAPEARFHAGGMRALLADALLKQPDAGTPTEADARVIAASLI